VASGSLINNEQFALGGVNSVRGYFEGDDYGDGGWFGSVELRTPIITSAIPIWSGSAPVGLRGSAFVDGGQRFLIDAPGGVQATSSLLGAGLGLSANINNRFDLRVVVGWPLRDSGNTSANDPRAYFSLGGQF
jgi:hemolysin activation/secretion protein